MAAGRIPYANRKDAIRAELKRCARARRTISYSELGKAVGIPAQCPWKPVLDEISREETNTVCPDITFLVINKQTGLSSQIDFKSAKHPTPEQRRKADEEIQKVFTHYS